MRLSRYTHTHTHTHTQTITTLIKNNTHTFFLYLQGNFTFYTRQRKSWHKYKTEILNTQLLPLLRPDLGTIIALNWGEGRGRTMSLVSHSAPPLLFPPLHHGDQRKDRIYGHAWLDPRDVNTRTWGCECTRGSKRLTYGFYMAHTHEAFLGNMNHTSKKHHQQGLRQSTPGT